MKIEYVNTVEHETNININTDQMDDNTHDVLIRTLYCLTGLIALLIVCDCIKNYN